MFYTLVTMVQKNRYFFIPFLVWIILGGLLILLYPKEDLFLTVNQLHNPVADILTTITTYLGDGKTYGGILLILLIRRQWRPFMISASILALVTLLVISGKHVFDEPRPITYFADIASTLHTVSWVPPHAWNSFPSGHTSTAFALFCFMAIWWEKKQMGLLFFALGLAAAHSRIYLCQHFFEDVYAGSIIGTFSSVFIYGLFELRKTGKPGTTRSRETVITPSAGVA
ncbi:phosphatase PAP2 family protein [Chitinophaga barathri]|uniref:Phosphatase PAP2 family protein n=1 Tax=Chitinophaga barathri TaxID=1647451 RepID=A0A3N4MEY2_9BACT|nr:phosphatase PAP2 family protein [Chitinophaga barathri]RPD38650.1 phosphatase PAP2 family protein [Chitinophaga barathri]